MSTLPLVALIGRTNVGKSTLFNRLLRQNKALTHDRPGVTRDRIYGQVQESRGGFALVDTGGLEPEAEGDLQTTIMEQAKEAIYEAHLILLVVDGKSGLSPIDQQLTALIRKSRKPMYLVVNKVDGPEQEDSCLGDFHALGLDMGAVSAAHGFGCPTLLQVIQERLPALEEGDPPPQVHPDLSLALLGRPNVGKSSVINTLVGDKRLIVSPEAGTTRDSVDVVLDREGSRYLFVDTAGVRRKSRIHDSLERFSVLRALKSSKRAQVTVLVVDGTQPLSAQDKKLLAFLDQEKTPLIVALNKIDLIPRPKRPKVKAYFEQELRFCPHVPVISTSSVTRAGLGGLLPLAEKLWIECGHRVATGELNRVLQEVTARHQPPVVKGRRAKFYYLTQAETMPPTFVFFMNDTSLLKDNYSKYLEKQIRKRFGLNMTPVSLVFRTSQG
ncbi:MAG: ribosome biogenesis GTPase Der [Desulfovermiculus sp.]|nr:ribosome biogenesis GTPase Der [Desulfovermiculus sp.]